MSGETPIQGEKIPSKSYIIYKKAMKVKKAGKAKKAINIKKLKAKKPMVSSRLAAEIKAAKKLETADKLKRLLKTSKKMNMAKFKVLGKPGFWARVVRGGNRIMEFGISTIEGTWGRAFLYLNFTTVVGRGFISYNLSAEDPKMKNEYNQFLKSQDLTTEDFSINTYGVFRKMFERDREWAKKTYYKGKLNPKEKKEIEKFSPWMLAKSLSEYIPLLPKEVVEATMKAVQEAEEAEKEKKEEENSPWGGVF